MEWILKFFLDNDSIQFIKGFILGQITFIICGTIILQFLFLRGPFILRRETKKHIKSRHLIKKKCVSIVQADILEKLKCDITDNETCKWFGVLLAQILSCYRNSVSAHLRIAELLDDLFKTKSSPFIGEIHIKNLSLGSNFPELTNARCSYSENGKLRTEVDIMWEDDISVTIDTQILINWPVSSIAALPIQFTLSVLKLSGTLCIEIDMERKECLNFENNQDTKDGFFTEFQFKDFALFHDFQGSEKNSSFSFPKPFFPTFI
jgi:hypothetical protein